MKLFVIMIGILLMVIALWMGAWCMNQIDFNDWKSFPTFVSFLILGVAGFVIIGYAIIEMEDKK